MGTQDTCPLLSLYPSPVPAVLANALRDLSHVNEKLKCDGFNYNLYFHLTINYLPVIGGTSLSHDTRSGEKGSQGKEPLAQGDLNRAVHLPGTKGGGRRGPEQEGGRVGWGRAGWLPRLHRCEQGGVLCLSVLREEDKGMPSFLLPWFMWVFLK